MFYFVRVQTASRTKESLCSFVSTTSTGCTLLSPNQFARLCENKPVTPDPYSGRFGLRANQLTAVQRAHDFMNWRQDGREPAQDGHIQQKKFVVCTIKISPFGYMLLMEEGTLEKGNGHNFHRDGYFRWIGSLHKSRSVISKGTTHELFRIQDEFMEIV